MHPELLFLACVLEALAGYPQALFATVRHPVVGMGALLNWLEKRLNLPKASGAARKRAGFFSLLLLAGISAMAGWLVHVLAHAVPFGWVLEVLAMASLLAQHSLVNHVQAIATPLRGGDLETARHALAKIVGRDTEALNENEIEAAATESLAESFSDGVVAPVFWGLLLGLPGMALYKAVNTADSMIGHKDERYYHFGWAAARTDDVMNYIPARLSALLIALAAWVPPDASSRDARRIARRDARKHASPNAGWPEAAMAGALGIIIGGPRAYQGKVHAMPVFGEGNIPDSETIERALRLFRYACGGLWAVVGVVVILGGA